MCKSPRSARFDNASVSQSMVALILQRTPPFCFGKIPILHDAGLPGGPMRDAALVGKCSGI